MRTKTIMMPIAALALGFTAACGAIGSAEPEVKTSNPPLSTATETPSATADGLAQDGGYDAPVSDDAPQPGITAFGNATVYPDVQFVVAAPEEYVPSKYAAGAEGEGSAVSFDITLTNVGSGPFDPSMFNLSVSSGGAEASQIFDSPDIGGSPTTPVLPGGDVTWTVAYQVADPASIILQATPDFQHTSAIYTNAQ